MIDILEWDTTNLGIKVGNLTLDDVSKEALLRAIEDAKSEKYDVLYLKGVLLPNECLANNIKLADERVTYSQVIHQKKNYSDRHVVSVLGTFMTKELLQLSYESGKYSRYHLDKDFPPSVFPTLYRLWMERSLSGEIATDVLVYKADGCILGMLTYKKKDDVVDVGIIAVSQDAAGKGIGTRLMQTFLSRFPVGTKVEVATQKRNSVACHYYEKNGFLVEDITNVYHIWIR